MPGCSGQEGAGSQQQPGWQIFPVGAPPLPLGFQAVQQQLLGGEGGGENRAVGGAASRSWAAQLAMKMSNRTRQAFICILQQQAHTPHCYCTAQHAVQSFPGAPAGLEPPPASFAPSPAASLPLPPQPALGVHSALRLAALAAACALSQLLPPSLLQPIQCTSTAAASNAATACPATSAASRTSKRIAAFADSGRAPRCPQAGCRRCNSKPAPTCAASCASASFRSRNNLSSSKQCVTKAPAHLRRQLRQRLVSLPQLC